MPKYVPSWKNQLKPKKRKTKEDYFAQYPMNPRLLEKCTYAKTDEEKAKIGNVVAIRKINKREMEEKVVIDKLLNEPNKTVVSIAKETGITKARVNEIMLSTKFTDILEKHGLGDNDYASALTKKFYDHFALEAGKDGDFPKYAEMIGRMKGVFQQKIDVSLNEKPKSLELVQNIINGEYEQRESTTEYEQDSV